MRQRGARGPGRQSEDGGSRLAPREHGDEETVRAAAKGGEAKVALRGEEGVGGTGGGGYGGTWRAADEGGDAILVLLGEDRAGHVDQPPARPDGRGRGAEDPVLLGHSA